MCVYEPSSLLFSFFFFFFWEYISRGFYVYIDWFRLAMSWFQFFCSMLSIINYGCLSIQNKFYPLDEIRWFSNSFYITFTHTICIKITIIIYLIAMGFLFIVLSLSIEIMKMKFLLFFLMLIWILLLFRVQIQAHVWLFYSL